MRATKAPQRGNVGAVPVLCERVCERVCVCVCLVSLGGARGHLGKGREATRGAVVHERPQPLEALLVVHPQVGAARGARQERAQGLSRIALPAVDLTARVAHPRAAARVVFVHKADGARIDGVGARRGRPGLGHGGTGALAHAAAALRLAVFFCFFFG